MTQFSNIFQGSRYKLTYDGMYHMDIPKTRQYDTGKIEVIARSSVGEALATADLKVVQRKDDYRGVLKNSPRRKHKLLTPQFNSVAHSLSTQFLQLPKRKLTQITQLIYSYVKEKTNSFSSSGSYLYSRKK